MQKIKDIKLYLFDMDGTLYIGNNLFGFTKELLNVIKQNGCKYMYMTNNSSKSVKDYIIKLNKLGIEASEEEFITSANATIYYLKKNYPNLKFYVCGTKSLVEEIKNSGLKVTTDLEQVEAIIIGNDTELTFKKLYDISYLLNTKELPYIATNPDYVCPTEFGSVPDCGSFCDMLYNATGKRPIFIGKPEPMMPILAMEQLGVAPKHTAVVGDRIYTDIKSGINAGCVSILVMSGETTEEILNNSLDKPDYVFKDAEEILKIIKN